MAELNMAEFTLDTGILIALLLIVVACFTVLIIISVKSLKKKKCEAFQSENPWTQGLEKVKKMLTA